MTEVVFFSVALAGGAIFLLFFSFHLAKSFKSQAVHARPHGIQHSRAVESQCLDDAAGGERQRSEKRSKIGFHGPMAWHQPNDPAARCIQSSDLVGGACLATGGVLVS